MNEVYEDTINYLKYYGEMNNSKIENIAYFLDCELKSYIKLQSNWNSLREWLENEKTRLAVECSHTYEDSLGKTKSVNEDIFNELNKVLDKMNELESGDNK